MHPLQEKKKSFLVSSKLISLFLQVVLKIYPYLLNPELEKAKIKEIFLDNANKIIFFPYPKDTYN